MKIEFSAQFQKNFKKRILISHSLLNKYLDRFSLFLRDKTISVLRDHALKGQMNNLRSFSITGDVRVIYKIENNKIIFYDIGSHNQVY